MKIQKTKYKFDLLIHFVYNMYRRVKMKKTDILKHIGISRQLFQSWFNHDDLDLFTDFNEKNNEITSNLVKRGRLINALKEGKNKQEAIFDAGLTPSEFLEIYEGSKKEKIIHQTFKKQ